MHETASWESKDTLGDEKWSLRHWDLCKVKLIFVCIHNGGKESGRFGLDVTTGPPLAGGVGSRTTFCNRAGGGSRTILDLQGHQGASVCVEADTDYGRPACVAGTQARQSSSGRWRGKMDRGEATTPPSTTSSCYSGIRNWSWLLERDSCLTIPDKRRKKAVAFLFQSRNPYSRQNHGKAKWEVVPLAVPGILSWGRASKSWSRKAQLHLKAAFENWPFLYGTGEGWTEQRLILQ